MDQQTHNIAEKLREISIRSTASGADVLAPEKAKSAVHGPKSITPLQLRKVNFPALPYAPGKFVLSEMKNVQRTVSNELIDFLDSVRDLLKLLLIVKTKHLQSTIPLPGDVLREIHYMGDKKGDSRMRNFEKQIFGKSDIVPTVRSKKSLDSYSDSIRDSSVFSAYRQMPIRATVHYDSSATMGKSQHRKSVSSSSHVDSKEFIKGTSAPIWQLSKKTKPIWQVVDNGDEEQRILNQRIIDNHRKALTEKMPLEQEFNNLLKKQFDIRDPGCERLTRSVLSKRKKSKDSSFNEHMEMFQAYVAGFETIEDYRYYLKSTQPHWFKDLLRESLDLGVVLTKDVILGFERLGSLYEVKFCAVEHSRAKLCLIVQSLPIWDISRSTVQRALDFVLRRILKSPFVDKDISKWLNARKLVRLVFPPIIPQIEKEKEKHAIADMPDPSKRKRRNALTGLETGPLISQQKRI